MLHRIFALLVTFALAFSAQRGDWRHLEQVGGSVTASAASDERCDLAGRVPQTEALWSASGAKGSLAKPHPLGWSGAWSRPPSPATIADSLAAARRGRARRGALRRRRDERGRIRRARSSAHVPHAGDGDGDGPG